MNIEKGSKCLCGSRHFLNGQSSDYLKVKSRQETGVLACSGDRTRWQRFKAALFPHLVRSKELTFAYIEAEVEKKQSEARKIIEEADEIAAKRDLIRQKSTKEFCAEIDDIFADDGLPPGAKALKLSKLIQENPRVTEQLERAEKVIENFSLNNYHGNKLVDKSHSCSIDNSLEET